MASATTFPFVVCRSYLEALQLVDGDVLPRNAAKVLDGHVGVEFRKARDGGVGACLAHVFLPKEELGEV